MRRLAVPACLKQADTSWQSLFLTAPEESWVKTSTTPGRLTQAATWVPNFLRALWVAGLVEQLRAYTLDGEPYI